MLTFGPKPFKRTGCVRCDGLRALTGKPNALCLRHDPSLSEAWRKEMKIPFEPLPQEKDHVDSKQ